MFVKERGDRQSGHGIETVTIEFRTEKPEIFEFLLQEGFAVDFVDNCTIREFLCLQLALCGDYTEKKVQTIFLNGKPVDDVDAAVLHENDRLALSAAMPGLVGATMRKRGFFAKMRHSISHNFEGGEDVGETRGKACLVHVKLFNLLARDLARDFLQRGVYFPTQRFRTLLGRRPDRFFLELGEVRIDGEALDSPRELAGRLSSSAETAQLVLLETEDEKNTP